MKPNRFFALCGLFLSVTCLANDTPENLLKTSDRARGGLDTGVTWKIEVINKEGANGQNDSQRSFNLKAKGNDALIESTAPKKHIGEVFLFNDKTMWFFKSGLRKPVAISSRQRLSGQASNGDIANTHYSRDYTPQLEKEETVQGEPTVVLMLKSKDASTTYDQIRYWVSKKTKLAVKAEFLTLQGEVFKRATFEYKNSIKVGGKSEPFISQMTIIDANFPDHQSILKYTQPASLELSSTLFNVNNLSR